MFFRVTKYKMKNGSAPDAVAKLQEVRDQVMVLPGMQHFINVANDDGHGYVVSLVTDKATSAANQAPCSSTSITTARRSCLSV